jgi:phage-related tail fiber protein
MSYLSIHTIKGIEKDAQSKTSGIPVVLTEIAVGDGNPESNAPTASMNALLNEVGRFSIDRVFVDPDDDSGTYTIEATPPDELDAQINEYAVIDSAGDVYIIGSLPSMPINTPVSGGVSVGATFLIKVGTSNGAAIQVQAPSNDHFATRFFVQNAIEEAFDPGLIFPGGTPGQLLAKKSSEPGDFEWIDKEEVVSIPAQPDALLVARNLADLENKGSARSNLDVYSKSQVDTKITNATAASAFPIGGSIYWDMPTPPAGFLLRNGAAVSRKTYAKLFSVLGTTYGAGDGVNTFNLPDDRGLFVRVADNGRGLDPSRSLRSVQDYATAVPRTTTPTAINNKGQTVPLQDASHPSIVCFVRVTKSMGFVLAGDVSTNVDVYNAVKGDSETRPINRALNFIIKAY